MVVGYILITAEPAKEHHVYSALFKTDEVEEIYPLFGEWDIIVKITAEDNEELKDKILKKVRPINGVLATKTLIGF